MQVFIYLEIAKIIKPENFFSYSKGMGYSKLTENAILLIKKV